MGKMLLINLWVHVNEQKESLNSDTNCKYNFQVRNSQLKKLHSDYVRLQ